MLMSAGSAGIQVATLVIAEVVRWALVHLAVLVGLVVAVPVGLEGGLKGELFRLLSLFFPQLVSFANEPLTNSSRPGQNTQPNRPQQPDRPQRPGRPNRYDKLRHYHLFPYHVTQKYSNLYTTSQAKQTEQTRPPREEWTRYGVRRGMA